MAKKSTQNKAQTSKKPAKNEASKSLTAQSAMKEFAAAVEAAQRYAEDLQTLATDGLKAAVEDVQNRQEKLQVQIADIGKKSMESMDAKVVATEKALGEFDAFNARVGAGIDREWEALSKRATALRGQLDGLKTEAVKRTEKGYASAEKAVEDFDKFVERNAASLEKEVLDFIDRAEPQIKSLRDTLALYNAKSAELARAGSTGATELWKDLKLRLNNAQKQFDLFSKSSARVWSDMEKAGRSAASNFGSKAKPPVKKPVKAKTAPGPKSRPAKTSTKKKVSAKKPVAKRTPAKPLKS